MMENALKKLNISALNEMQESSVKAAKTGKDVILIAPTGSGKTLAFLLPLLSNLKTGVKGVQALVLVPSRELALQIEQVFKQMGTSFKVNCCYGGHAVRIEKNNLAHPPAVLIGTPGRIAYHLEHQNFDESFIETLVLDEFDKALEFGFENDMSYIIGSLLSLKQRILTSATKMEEIPAFVKLNAPVEVDYSKNIEAKPDLKLKKITVPAADKLDYLFRLLSKIGSKNTLVFCNHRETVDRISDLLFENGLGHDVFHGGMEQFDREKALLKFRNGSHRILITTDLAARGLDIPEVEHIVHYQLPYTEDAYIHRNGRTARMHAKGTAYAILTSEENYKYLPDDIEEEVLEDRYVLPQESDWVTLYLAHGKKDKINKIDIVGLFLQKGDLVKEDLGLIEVKDTTSYVAVKRSKITQLLKKLNGEKIKGKKLKLEIAS
ncbi:DEAD/DEAH box helicase [Pedobacter sp. MR2016-19]|uniref:DEAD/DEAH box helicase n=1 Tax=unclassified Pedobacter TaxID=2628915 RepID=UPI001876BD93|nr:MULTISPECIES: DEAD/DEAH box helicase [unclassified Pedobacter]MBE5321632.1 DEAD/DEAH box helicase [Pedobacter sp. MR2016-19]QXU40149.1 DEAD/DEAH box helicase [Pedobacter sp. D749]